jgi:hypothetical protein
MHQNPVPRLRALATLLPLFVFGVVSQPAPAAATAAASSQGTLHFEVVDVQDSMGTSLPMAPAGFMLTLGGAVLNQQPDAGNSGNGMVSFGGSATSSGSGRTSVSDLASNIQCTADPQGSYGGFEDAFETAITVANTSGQTIVLILRFDASYALATSTTLAGETAQAEIDINWALPAGTSGALTSCPAGTLSGSTLLLGQSTVNAGASDSQALSSCEISVSVPDGITSSGGLAPTLSTCEAVSPAVVPALPTPAALALLALLAFSGWWVLRGRLARRGSSGRAG